MTATDDQDAQRDLLAALEHYCSCYVDDGGAVITPCAGHRQLSDDPVWLRRLRFERYSGCVLMRGEWEPVMAQHTWVDQYVDHVLLRGEWAA